MATQIAVLNASGVFTLLDGTSFKLGTETCNSWLEAKNSFRYEGKAENVTVRPGKGGYYAFKRVHGKLYTVFVSPTLDLSISRLEAVIGDLLQKGEDNKPIAAPPKQTEMDQMRSQLVAMEQKLEALTGIQHKLETVIGEMAELKNSLPRQNVA